MQPTAPAVGMGAQEPTSPKGRQKLASKVFLVVHHVVLSQERQKLFLKGMLFVMFFLTGNIFCHRRDIRFADAENSISGLPGKVRAPFRSDPA